ncbi:hypothetical protein Ahy_B06g080805 [Arachis hypogaea]|uniref:GRF-type domain-containing protein n=1 Tax=Arachis hypogaea TaxID=3818 RepID=A0A444YJ18_ARAHY|nr:hypothetical protein Ahy_B06g080805 [Arachis hypogaea]
MVGSGDHCSSSNMRAGDNWSYSMNSNESIVGRRKKRWVSPKCYCGCDAILLMSANKNNPDRLFLHCPKFKTAEGRCSFFVWLDDYVSSFNEHVSKTISKGVLPQNQHRFEGLSDAVDDKVEELEIRLIGLENQLGKSKKKMGESRCLGLGCSIFAFLIRVMVACLFRTSMYAT